jgi:hypothetical protein
MGVRVEIAQFYAEAGDITSATPDADANRAALAAKISQIGNAENESWGVELGYRYDDSPVICGEVGQVPTDPLVYVGNTVPGGRLPHVFLEPGVSLHDKLGTYFSLVVFDDSDSTAVEAAAEKLGIPLEIVRVPRSDLRNIYQRNLVLVRPDQHIAWRGDVLPSDLEQMLSLVTGC